MQSSKKQKASSDELQLKRMGGQKFATAETLSYGREYLDKLTQKDSSGRYAEKLYSTQAETLGRQPVDETSKLGFTDFRTSGRAGMQAAAAADEEQTGAEMAIIQAGLGNASEVSRSTRVAAQSQAQLEEAKLRAAQQQRAANQQALGTAIGIGAGMYRTKKVDPLANPNQVAPDYKNAIFSNPNVPQDIDLNSLDSLGGGIRYV